MSEGNGRPNAKMIVKHTTELLRAKATTPETAVHALQLIRDGLRLKYNFSEDELKPIAELIGELRTKVEVS
jgi:hypothetical protein